MDKFFASFVKVTGELGNILFFRTKRFYQDKKAQNRRIKGPAIVVSNHKSIYDFVLIMFTFFSRNLRCLVADVLYKKKFVGFMLKKFGSIKVNRNRHDLTFVDECQRILDKGELLKYIQRLEFHLKMKMNHFHLPSVRL
jgi:1-acyl-sn-glycerol-3-phosphate acyltransferase